VVGRRGNAELLVALDQAAEALGLRVGIALAQARAMHPALEVVEEDPAADAALIAAIADWCQRYTPLVARDEPDGLLLDIGGCTHLFGGEPALRDDLAARLTRYGFAVRTGIADTIGAASAAARFADGAAVAPGAEREFLLPLPLAALRLSPDAVAVLRRVGLKRIGDIADLPRAPLTARFGADLLRQLDRALGREQEPLNPLLPAPPYFTEQRFVEPIAREEDVLRTVERLAGRLRPMLESRGEGARRIELTLFRTDGAVRRIAVGASRPVRDPGELRALFTERLAALASAYDPGFGFDLARLSILAADPAPPTQAGLSRAGAAAEAAALDRLTDRLAARLGARRVERLIAQESHIPELAALATPAQSQRAEDRDGWDSFRRFRAANDLPPRPLRLLAKPEPIQVSAAIIEGPPFRFRWRQALHEVVAAEGPERIEGMWWCEDDGPARDYFRVEDKLGLRFWLFRAGLHRDGVTNWFMHGLFA
jgi:protein ImuB